MTTEIKLRRGTADDFVARSLPGGAEQDISSDLITVKFAKERKATALLTLTSADANQIEKLTTTSQASTAVTSFTASSAGTIIEAAGATFVDAEVLKGEEVVVAGDQAGTYTVKQVISNTKLRLEETSITTDAAPSSTVTVNRGDGWFKVKLDAADVLLLTFSKGLAFCYRTPGGVGDPRFIGEICVVMEDAP